MPKKAPDPNPNDLLLDLLYALEDWDQERALSNLTALTVLVQDGGDLPRVEYDDCSPSEKGFSHPFYIALPNGRSISKR